MIRIRELSKVYSSSAGQEVRALDGVSLSVERGEFVAIVGASGSGKTTLMNIIGCLDTPTEGEYRLDGTEVSALNETQLSRVRSEKISFVFQGFNLIPTLTAAENVELPLIYRGVEAATRRRLWSQALKSVGLEKRADHLPSELSGGQQQRVAIARALAADAPIILADEPCGNLDSKAGAAVMDMLHRLHETGKTVVLITHDDKAAMTADRRIRIHDGKVISIKEE